MSSASHEIYLAHADLIERALATVCRRNSVFGADAEDFSSTARLHLIEDDYAVLRRFEGRSSLPTYLTVVITRQFQDWRNAKWGKWRPSAEAKRLGPTAVRLETLTVRDRLSLDEAYELLRSKYEVTESRAEVEALAVRFPIRHKRSFVDDTVINTLPTPIPPPDDDVAGREAAVMAHHVSGVLTTEVRKLPAQDRLILKMRFEDDCPIADIARALRLEAKPLYRRIEKVLTALRTSLEAEGITAAAIAGAMADRGFHFLEAGETRNDVRPFDRSGHASALTGGHRE
ncbi:MAG: sigma-70 family RNA polymerase sigma factor [Acidobacteria bacterium]|nr:sigma-70 family RNA polymerase sigma factor [Acidobacteriota bacterium]